MVILFAVFTSTCFILVEFIKYYYAIACIRYVRKCKWYNMYMYVNKRVELAHRGIAL